MQSAPNIQSSFQYRPITEDVIDEEMAALPCSICNGTDEDGFLFCDLCNKGFHAICSNITRLPGPDEDWHCKNCKLVLRRYGYNSLPPSRHWNGWFILNHGASRERCKETFSLNFEYTKMKKSQSSTADEGVIATIHAKGNNPYGDFEIKGLLKKGLGENHYEMNCQKFYVPSRALPERNKIIKEKKAAAAAAARAAEHAASAAVFSSIAQATQNNGILPSLESKRKIASLTVQSSSTSNNNGSSSNSAFKQVTKRPRTDVEPNTPTVGISARRPPADPPAGSLVSQLRRKIAGLERKLMAFAGVYKAVIFTDIDCSIGDQDGKGLVKLWAKLAQKYTNKNVVWVSEVPRAPFDVLLRAHDAQYVTATMASSNNDQKYRTLLASLKAAGAVCTAIERVVPHDGLGDRSSPAAGSALSNSMSQPTMRNALCIVGPPGHRVGYNGLLGNPSAGSFFNSAAVGAIYAHGTFNERVALIDMNLRPGSGTCDVLDHYVRSLRGRRAEELFYGSVDAVDAMVPVPQVELHRNLSLWASCSEIMEVPNSVTSEEWRAAFQTVFNGLDEFAPSIVILSAGFDGLESDSTTTKAQLRGTLSPADYRWLSASLLQVCPRVVSVLEDPGQDHARFLDGYSKHIAAFITDNKGSKDSDRVENI